MEKNFLPWDFWVARFHLIREVAARLGNDLDAALDKPLPLPVSLKGVERFIL